MLILIHIQVRKYCDVLIMETLYSQLYFCNEDAWISDRLRTSKVAKLCGATRRILTSSCFWLMAAIQKIKVERCKIARKTTDKEMQKFVAISFLAKQRANKQWIHYFWNVWMRRVAIFFFCQERSTGSHVFSSFHIAFFWSAIYVIQFCR